jgi:hypothetical protein
MHLPAAREKPVKSRRAGAVNAARVRRTLTATTGLCACLDGFRLGLTRLFGSVVFFGEIVLSALPLTGSGYCLNADLR